MTALTLAGLAPGIVAALVYWVPRAAMRARRARQAEERALAESPQGKALAECFSKGLERVQAALRGTAIQSREPEPHIEVLKLRAAKVSTRLYCNGNSDASRIVDNAINSGDRDALLAILREESP